MIDDTLSRVNLTPGVVERWLEVARSTAANYSGLGIVTDAIGDELARVEQDGSLTIYLILATGVEISMRVEPHEWAWMEGVRNQ